MARGVAFAYLVLLNLNLILAFRRDQNIEHVSVGATHMQNERDNLFKNSDEEESERPNYQKQMVAAINKALKPLNDQIANLSARVEELEEQEGRRLLSGRNSAEDIAANNIFKKIGKVAKDAGEGIAKGTVDAGKAIAKGATAAGKGIVTGVDASGKAIDSAAKAVGNFFGGAAGEICTKALVLSMDIVVVDDATGVAGACAEMCGATDAEVEVVGGGPEDPVADTVAVALGAGCAAGCAIAVDDLTFDKWGTEDMAKAICGYCGL